MPSECLKTDFMSQTDLAPLEREVLAQYQSLALKLWKLSEEIRKLHQRRPQGGEFGPLTGQAHALLQNVRKLERNMGLVYTSFRTAVYSLSIQNEEPQEGRVIGEDLKKTEKVSDSGNAVTELESEDGDLVWY